ncbi:MAG: hypothetical protein IPN71_03150 [Fibrobacteres bacterium]|nr:hypothetical protein [Fibrobacterota bacterium]
MPRLLHSTLHPGTAEDWIAGLRLASIAMNLSPVHPTLLLRLVQTDREEFARFELVFGLFRTVWTCPVTVDLAAKRIVSNGASAHFETFEQTLCWQVSEHGLSIQSDLQWSGARTGLEDLVLRSRFSFPGHGMGATASESPTRRMAMDGQAAA